jgi:threonine dehydratase
LGPRHENHQPIGAFKVRGGVNLVAQMSESDRRRGLISASTGNHGQSIAYAGRLFDAAVKIVVPEGANPGKVAAIRGMGAEVLFHGAKFEESVQHCERLAKQHGFRYVHAANEPDLIAGVATHTLEVLLEQPDVDTIIVPLGMGSGAAGACIAAHGLNPAIRVIAVQSEASPAGYESWKQRTLVTAGNATFAEGVATGSAAELTQSIIQAALHDFVLVSDNQIRQAMVWMIERAHTLAEGAGASPLAAAHRIRHSLRARKVALICSGGNTSVDHLRQALTASGS